ncbi:MAG: hypothetical protein KAS93_06435 [Gammaproteobacteria bacterium]|nr:hypothetical protein [Gammaproteobacteria bacterium]
MFGDGIENISLRNAIFRTLTDRISTWRNEYANESEILTEIEALRTYLDAGERARIERNQIRRESVSMPPPPVHRFFQPPQGIVPQQLTSQIREPKILTIFGSIQYANTSANLTALQTIIAENYENIAGICLNDVFLGNEGAQYIAAIISDKQIEALYISRSELRDADFAVICRVLEHNQALQILRLNNCGVTSDFCIGNILPVVRSAKNLHTLSLVGNFQLGDKAGWELRDLLKDMDSSLLGLDLERTRVSKRCRKSCANRIVRCNGLPVIPTIAKTSQHNRSAILSCNRLEVNDAEPQQLAPS